MKALIPFVLLSVALAAPSPEPWCFRIAMPCWKAKRAVDAFTRSVKESASIVARSEDTTAAAPLAKLPQSSTFFAEQALNELAHISALASGKPITFYTDLPISFSTDVDFHTKQESKRDALPDDMKWCLDCWDKRNDDNERRWCFRQDRLSPCLKAHEKEKRWCFRIAMPCWKAKRAAEAILEAADEQIDGHLDSVSKREASACMRPGQACWQAKRDLYAMKSVARDILDKLA